MFDTYFVDDIYHVGDKIVFVSIPVVVAFISVSF